MGAWDKNTPLGTAPLSEGDDRIRELKAALEEALSHEDSTFPGASPASSPIFIPGMKRGSTGARPIGDSLVTGRFYANTTLDIIERYNGASWDSVASNIETGSKALFYMVSAPTGWIAVAIDDKFLRVVTSAGTGGTTGGTVAASTSLAHTHAVDSHTHSISSDGAHTHTRAAGALLNAVALGSFSTTTDSQGIHAHTGTAGAATPGTDSKLGAFAFADIIIATKA